MISACKHCRAVWNNDKKYYEYSRENPYIDRFGNTHVMHLPNQCPNFILQPQRKYNTRISSSTSEGKLCIYDGCNGKWDPSRNLYYDKDAIYTDRDGNEQHGIGHRKFRCPFFKKHTSPQD